MRIKATSILSGRNQSRFQSFTGSEPKLDFRDRQPQ
jgi:hypothetical protein